MQPSFREALMPLWGPKVLERLEREMDARGQRILSRYYNAHGVWMVELDDGTQLSYVGGVWR